MKNPINAILFFAITFTSLYFFTACEDTNTTQKVEYSIEAVNKAIIEATKNQDPSDIKVGQYVKYEDNYQIELTDPKISATVETKILDLIEDETKYTITLQETQTLFNEDGDNTKKITEQKVEIEKGLVALKNSNLFKGAATSGLITSNFSLQNDSELKIYNLKVESIDAPYPNSVQEKMGCDPKDPCEFKGTRIRFLVNEFVNKTDPIEFSVDRIYMNDGSFLNGTFSSCISRFFEAPERDYYIKQCSVLRDYTNIIE